MNGVRLGVYQSLQNKFDPADSRSKFLFNALSAGLSGMLGAFIGSPFFLIKVRQQAYAAHGTAVGAQHRIPHLFPALLSIYRTEGVYGLFRGSSAAMTRVAVGSAMQLATYDAVKSSILNLGHFGNGTVVFFLSSLVSGIVVTTAMNPFDVVATRLYNQRVTKGHGDMYAGVVDCFAKSLREEGLRAFMKGWSAHYLRLGPHTTLVFVFWENMRASVAQRRG